MNTDRKPRRPEPVCSYCFHERFWHDTGLLGTGKDCHHRECFMDPDWRHAFEEAK